jgi:ectoine hydroxylase-related dioxygenase (phytanoyl-CoA dioxygenase family)
VWLALYDTDEKNAAMKVVKGSHNQGMFKHHTNKSSNLVLDQEVSSEQIRHEDIVSLNLKAGEISLHDDGLLHGSEANNSNRRRCGVTMRFAPVNVKADLSVWPHFETQLARGIDNFKNNPLAAIPRGEATPVRKFQYSKEFANEW